MTTKQEALEAILRKVRGWEQPHEEVRLTPAEEVFDFLVEAARDIDTLRVLARQGTDTTEALEARLLTVGAAAVYLLTNEVTVVEGRSLDEWLKDGSDRWAAMVGGKPVGLPGIISYVIEAGGDRVQRKPDPTLPPQGDEETEAVG